MFFGGGQRFGFPNMQQRGGSTQFIFRNGNVEYKVFSGGNTNSNKGRSYSARVHQESDEEDDVNDILKLLLNQGLHGKSKSATRSRHEKAQNDDDKLKQKMFETLNNRIRQQSYEKYNAITFILFVACLFFFILGISWLSFKKR